MTARASVPVAPPIVVMGVSGAGKTTIGRLLAARLGTAFIDADDLHDAPSKRKMSAGVPLTDADRVPWLDRVGRAIGDAPRPPVVACSALRAGYRQRLRRDAPGLVFVHLHGASDLIADRLGAREHEYMPSSLLDSQIAALEPLTRDESGLLVDAALAPPRIVRVVTEWLEGRASGGSAIR